MEEIRYGSLNITTNCSHCGSSMIITGPAREIPCNSCHEILNISEEIWNTVFQKLEQLVINFNLYEENSYSIASGKSKLKITMKNSPPACPKCHTTLDLKNANSFSGEIRCTDCGDTTAFTDAPSWLEDAGLKKIIETNSEWYVRFQGVPVWLKQKQEKEALKQKKHEIEKQQRLYDKELKNLTSQITKMEAFSFSKYSTGYFASIMMGIFIIGFPIIFIPPLSKLVGQAICDGEYQRKTFKSGKGKTSIKFYCKKGTYLEPMDGMMFLYGPGAGILFLSSLWTLYIPFHRFRKRKEINILKDQLNDLLAKGPPTKNMPS